MIRSTLASCFTKSLLVSLLLAVVASSVHAAIVIDGVLDEPEWSEAVVFDAFITTEPLSLEPAKYKTIARLLVNADGIHIGFTNFQPPSVKRVRRKFGRDAFLQADRNVVNIDFDGTGLSAYDFSVSSSNSIQDGVISDETHYSKSWDGTWYSQTSEDEQAWYSEILVPWTVAPMVATDAAMKTMGVYFSRVVFDESLRFAYPNAAMGRPTFLSNLHRVQVESVETSTLDWFPFVTSSNDLYNSGSDWKVGLDMVWRPSSSHQITASINPDFGQVESDDLVVNFSAIESFFDEKRPFFTENQTLFDLQIPTGDRLIHTRRIGAAPDAGEAGFSDIDFAAKLTGYGESLDYGIFAVTEGDARVSEGRDYLATRLQGRVGDITLGHTLTYAERPTLERKAMLNALDVDWQYSDKVLLSAIVMQSDIEQVANEFNDHENEDSKDLGVWVEWEYAPSDNWNFLSAAIHYGDEFEMNDMGFLKRNDFQELFNQVIHRVNQYPESSSLRSTTDELTFGASQTTNGDRNPDWLEVKRVAVLKSTRELELGWGYESSAYNNLITRGNGLFRTKPQMWSYVNYRSPRGNKFEYELSGIINNEGTEAWSPRIKLEPTYYIGETLTLSGKLVYRKFNEWLLWDGQTQQLSTYAADLYRVEFRLDWYPSSRQEIRLKFEWIGIEAEATSGFSLSDSGHIRQSDINVKDFSVSDTAFQLRYRYELAPLSDIFLVYSRGGLVEDNDASRGPGQLFGDGWNEINAESLIAKIRYRF